MVAVVGQPALGLSLGRHPFDDALRGRLGQRLLTDAGQQDAQPLRAVRVSAGHGSEPVRQVHGLRHRGAPTWSWSLVVLSVVHGFGPQDAPQSHQGVRTAAQVV